MHINFEAQPRAVIDNRPVKEFLNRKNRYSINAMVVGGFDRRIYDINLGAPGSYHDAHIWTLGMSMAFFETRVPRMMVLGDKAYPLSDVLLTPYSEEESLGDDGKCLFNIR